MVDLSADHEQIAFNSLPLKELGDSCRTNTDSWPIPACRLRTMFKRFGKGLFQSQPGLVTHHTTYRSHLEKLRSAGNARKYRLANGSVSIHCDDADDHMLMPTT
jgi:hypothetical protein